MEKSKINVAILAEQRNSFRKPMAVGLSAMLASIGIRNEVFYRGLEDITYCKFPKLGVHFLFKLRRKILKEIRFAYFVFKLRRYNVIVVVSNLPGVFYRNLFRINLLRIFFKKCRIINYDLHYLGTHPNWQSELEANGQYNIKHYDGYLLGSVDNFNTNSLPNENYAVIGFNFSQDKIFKLRTIPEKKNLAIIDFERSEAHLKNIEITGFVKKILIKNGIEFIQLEGQYKRNELIDLFKQSKLFFMTTSESFGLSIVEAQIAGNYVFTPSIKWPMAHIKADKSLTDNFIVYNSGDELDLEYKILSALNSHKTTEVVDRINREQNYFTEGDVKALEDFFEKME